MAKNKGLPKKYAKMGFKKGWVAYKKALASAARKRKSSTKKTVKKRSTTAKKSNPGGRRTAKYTNIGIMKWVTGLHALKRTGIIAGAKQALTGDFEGAVDTITDQAGDTDNLVAAGLPPVICAGVKKVFGKVPLIELGKYKINLL